MSSSRLKLRMPVAQFVETGQEGLLAERALQIGDQIAKSADGPPRACFSRHFGPGPRM